MMATAGAMAMGGVASTAVPAARTFRRRPRRAARNGFSAYVSALARWSSPSPPTRSPAHGSRRVSARRLSHYWGPALGRQPRGLRPLEISDPGRGLARRRPWKAGPDALWVAPAT